jgi:hypothetical protein
VYDEATLKAIGRSAAAAVRSQHEWIHRRVEAVTFPWPEAGVYRRSVSIDFTIPQIRPVRGRHDTAEGDTDPTASGKAGRYYVPLSLLKKWPPVNRLDLRSGAGQPVPLLTTQQNGIVDSELLVALAEAALEAAHLSLPPEVADTIRLLAKSRGDEASRALLSLVPPNKLGTPDDIHRVLRSDRLFTDLAGGLRDSTILWLRVDGHPGDREIVKFAYEIPLDWKVGEWTAQAFGLKPFSTKFESPHFGGTGSYHLNIRVPSPLSICDAQIGIIEPQTAEGDPDVDKLVGSCTARELDKSVRIARDTLQLYASRLGQEARFYVRGERTGARGEAWVALMLPKRSFPYAASIGSLAVAILLTAYFLRLSEVLALAEPAVAILALVPALLAYLVVRPAEHVIVGQFLAGARRVVTAAAGLPLIGAVAIVANGRDWTSGLKIIFAVLVALAWIASGVLSAGIALPRSSKRQPFSGPN